MCRSAAHAVLRAVARGDLQRIIVAWRLPFFPGVHRHAHRAPAAEVAVERGAEARALVDLVLSSAGEPDGKLATSLLSIDPEKPMCGRL